jgi:hypothetical protein
MPGALRAKLVASYEDAGAPWGHTETAALLYAWHAGDALLQGGAR